MQLSRLGAFSLALVLGGAMASRAEIALPQQIEASPAALTPASSASETDKAAPHDPGRGAVTNLPLPRYVSLKTNEGNARRGPGLTHRIDWVFTRAGMPLRVTAEYERWRRVEDAEGAGGWVHYSLLSGSRTALVSLDMAQFHSLPDDQSEVAFQAEVGVIAKVMECNPDWCRLAVDGQRGWIRKTAIWGVDPGEIVE